MSDPFDTPTKSAVRAAIAKQLEPAIYQWPGPTDAPFSISIRLLTEDEIDNAHLEAQRYAAKRKSDLAIDPEFLDREIHRQLTWRACVDPLGEGPRAPLFPSDADMRALPSTVQDGLYRLYLEHQERVAPAWAYTDEELGKAIDALKAPHADLPLSQLDFDSMLRLVLAMAKASRGT